MKLLIDHKTVERATHIRANQPDGQLKFYLIDDAIIITQNGHNLHRLVEQVVHAQVGWDIARPGFCREKDLGKRRTKVTIYRPLAHGTQYHYTLNNVLEIKKTYNEKPMQGILGLDLKSSG